MISVPSSPPSQLGYRMPAEWKPHEATWLAWPHNEEMWPESLGRLEEVYVQMVRALAFGEKVKILVRDEPAEASVRTKLARRGVGGPEVLYFRIPTADVWIRDYGPTFLAVKEATGGRPGVAGVRWKFNAWGGKYEALRRDATVPERMLELLQMPSFEPGIVLEGGSIEVNGDGLALTTEECLLNPNRNPGLGRGDLERYLADYLGVSRVLWLGRGLAGDDTDGHVDDLARFVSPDTVVGAVEEDPGDENFAALRENLSRLGEAGDHGGRRLRIVRLPMPGRVGDSEGRYPASYANFYIGNEAVLAPVFDDPKDEDALAILRDLFPGRRVVGIPARLLVEGRGAIHCVMLQEPQRHKSKTGSVVDC